MTPVDAGQKVSELRRRDRHGAVGGARPQESASLQPLGEQACALAVMPDHLQEVAPATAKAKQMAAQRIAPKHLLDLQRQARKSLPHVRVPGRQPHPHAVRNRDRQSVSSPRTTCSRTSTLTRPSTMILRPFAVTTSRRDEASSSCRLVRPGGVINAGTKPATPPSRPSR